jgi:hypothetical protein
MVVEISGEFKVILALVSIQVDKHNLRIHLILFFKVIFNIQKKSLTEQGVLVDVLPNTCLLFSPF